ncbi:hypothetical protein AGMMS49545_22670 [Betaproteobacteria bacterium]|nr:hypothetical protein AGMMS49545_22670 [Betaproteobacteria bacterium]GHU48561.1 hypothetical protein AGMMS50289_25310 [Betaproteobacteria bacterium]
MNEQMGVSIKVTLDARQAEAAAKEVKKSVEGVGEAAGGKHEIALDGGSAIATADAVAERLLSIEAAASSASTVTLDGHDAVLEAARVEAGIEHIGEAAEKTTGKFGKMRAGAESISQQLKTLQNIALSLGGVNLGVSGFGDLVKLVDEYGQMASRIKMATDSAEEYEAVQARLLETASNTYRPLAEAQEMYLRTADALKSMGYNTRQALDVSDSLSYLMVTNAASSERAAAATQAYATALQKGEVDAMQWKTILAATPTIVDKIATATGMAAEIDRLNEEECARLTAKGLALNAAFFSEDKGRCQVVGARRAVPVLIWEADPPKILTPAT